MPNPESKFSQMSQDAENANHRSEMMRAMVEEFEKVEKYADLKKILQGKVAKDLFEDSNVSIVQILEVVDGIENGSIEFYGSAEPIYLNGKLIVLPGIVESVLNRCRRNKKYGPHKESIDSLSREKESKEGEEGRETTQNLKKLFKEILGKKVTNIDAANDLSDLIEAVGFGVKKYQEMHFDPTELKEDLKNLKLIFDWQAPLSDIEKIKNPTIKEKVSGFRDQLIKLGALVDTISKVPNTHLRRHEAGWRVAHINPSAKTVDLIGVVENNKQKRKDNVPIEDITFSKTEDPFING